MVKPIHVLLALMAVGALCLVTMFVYPEKGIKISEEITLNFPTANHFFEEDTTAVLDVDSLLNSYEEPIDSTEIKDSIERYKVAQRQKLLNLQFAKNQKHLAEFNKALEALKAGKKRTVRILHYGDSQIEGDRITSYLRQKYQAEYGGSGPGMLPVMQFIPNMSIRQEQSENWHRYTVFGRKDTTIPDNKFGLRGIISRFTPYLRDSASVGELQTAWVKVRPSNLGYGRVRSYQKMRLFYGRCTVPVAIEIKVDGEVVHTDSLTAGAGPQVFEYTFQNGTPSECLLTFSGQESPDFYALSLEGSSGVLMDNVAMRGSSGTIFNKINRGQLAQQFTGENIHLVLLQYGGNTVPYIDSKEEAERYGRWFASQIRTLKALLPEASFVLIGPSDMSKKEGTEYVTYPYLPAVRDALKKAAHDEGAAFWDIYEVMGGRNSMPSWVAAEPALAGSDYVHFTPKGAKRIAELFYNAMQNDLKNYEAEQAAIEAQKAAEKAALDSAKNVVDSVESLP